MAITQEQVDKIEIGDYVVVAYVYSDDDIQIHKGEVHTKYEQPGFKFVNGYAIDPIISWATILIHTPKSKPSWRNAKVIKTGGNTPVYWVRQNSSLFVGTNGVEKLSHEFTTDPEIVVN